MIQEITTPFTDIYDSFLSKITDDMYLELDKEDTEKMLEELLISAIPSFEFPRKDLSYVKSDVAEVTTSEDDEVKEFIVPGYFNSQLNSEEINILATYMIVQWLGQQLASVENVRMKYSGADFKFTSQANHMQKLLQLKNDYQREGFHLQRLYKRRKRDENGVMRSTFGQIMQPPSDWEEGSDDY